jgi:hypothetical protein
VVAKADQIHGRVFPLPSGCSQEMRLGSNALTASIATAAGGCLRAEVDSTMAGCAELETDLLAGAVFSAGVGNKDSGEACSTSGAVLRSAAVAETAGTLTFRFEWAVPAAAGRPSPSSDVDLG